MLVYRLWLLALCLSVVSDVFAETMTWSGAADKLWSNPANWTPSGSAAGSKIPAAGDAVVIGSGKTVVLAAETPRLASVDLTGTLSFTNWTTKLDADSVTVKKNGKLAVACAFTEAQMSNRVYVTCESFDLQSGGSIALDSLGYVYRNGPGKGGTSSSTGAAGHGGSGGLAGWYNSRTYRYMRQTGSVYGLACDSLAAPDQPGSGSAGRTGQNNFMGITGGGAVRIAATGHVTLNGSISAAGGEAYAGAYPGAAGGAVWISCATISGSGTINVAGGSPKYSGNTCAAGGGGGRIALTWSDSAGQKAYAPSITFNCGGPVGQVPCSNSGTGEAGTLYLTDASFFPGSTCKGGGRVYYATPPASLTIASLTVTTATLEFPQAFPITITGDLTVQSKGNFVVCGRTVTVGGNVLVKGSSSGVDGAANLVVADFGKLVVGGDFSLQNYGYLRTDTGVTNETTGVWGVDLAVGGKFSLAANTTWFPCSTPTNFAMSSTRLRAKSVEIASGASINGCEKGWQLAYFAPGSGYGPGSYDVGRLKSYYSNADDMKGSSHAGRGGLNTCAAGTRGGTYDDPKTPMLPGSSGGYNGGNLVSSPGGGQVWIESVGTITVDGSINMDGGLTQVSWGAGSGGSIYLLARRILGAGTISARGGASSTKDVADWRCGNGGGGGGYVTFRTKYDVTNTFSGTVCVSGGVAKTVGDYDETTGRYLSDNRGWPGKITQLHLRAGLVLTIK